MHRSLGTSAHTNQITVTFLNCIKETSSTNLFNLFLLLRELFCLLNCNTKLYHKTRIPG